MNNDLISRAALFDAMRDEEFQTFVPLDEIDAVIDKAPAVDAEVVRHGRWKLETKRLASCSSCGMLRDIETQTAWCYCPNCGAKMDAEVEG